MTQQPRPAICCCCCCCCGGVGWECYSTQPGTTQSNKHTHTHKALDSPKLHLTAPHAKLRNILLRWLSRRYGNRPPPPAGGCSQFCWNPAHGVPALPGTDIIKPLSPPVAPVHCSPFTVLEMRGRCTGYACSYVDLEDHLPEPYVTGSEWGGVLSSGGLVPWMMSQGAADDAARFIAYCHLREKGNRRAFACVCAVYEIPEYGWGLPKGEPATGRIYKYRRVVGLVPAFLGNDSVNG